MTGIDPRPGPGMRAAALGLTWDMDLADTPGWLTGGDDMGVQTSIE